MHLFRRRQTRHRDQAPQPVEPQAIDDRVRSTDTPYFLPKDAEEDSRLNFQHRALYAAIGNHYLAPLTPETDTILDVGTGTGIWPVEMSHLFPKAHILGLDVSSTSFQHPSTAAYTFMLGDILHGLPFPDKQFAFVHQRLLVAAIPTAQWPTAIKELIRVTRPGGWIEILEIGVTIKQAGPETTRLLAWMGACSKERGFDMAVVPQLGQMLIEAGIQDVEIHHIPAPLGTWGGHVGAMLKANVLSAFGALKGIYCTQAQMSPAHFDAWVKDVSEEWETLRASYVFHAAYGRRALGA
ncbi:hypothetical protein KDH_27910 [Dictyobacter sp. S3.2.2.5]|uniref:Methyltransferase domain-containing protein n=1 Tax=Dictyobacter halimunensis TaxID=3026934 RepID=A0ABQ6FQE0_9CHLR|nr:hypothetical protein KDH_27910 [Dictyobacter sp. S3.2.2.5]